MRARRGLIEAVTGLSVVVWVSEGAPELPGATMRVFCSVRLFGGFTRYRITFYKSPKSVCWASVRRSFGCGGPQPNM